MSVGAPISKRSTSLVADAVTSRIMKRFSGSGSKLRMRTFLLPSLSVKVSIVLREAMSSDLELLHSDVFDRVEALAVAARASCRRGMPVLQEIVADDLLGRLRR